MMYELRKLQNSVTQILYTICGFCFPVLCLEKLSDANVTNTVRETSARIPFQTTHILYQVFNEGIFPKLIDQWVLNVYTNIRTQSHHIIMMMRLVAWKSSPRMNNTALSICCGKASIAMCYDTITVVKGGSKLDAKQVIFFDQRLQYDALINTVTVFDLYVP